jgi:nickel transport system substrate-binding protein
MELITMMTTISRRHLLGGVGSAFLATALGLRSLPALASDVAPSADTVVFLNFRDLRDLNPHLYGGEMFAQEMLFEGLVTLGNDGSYHPAIAESWSISPDGLTYTFKIRPGITFSDGEKLDAYAVQANFDAIIDNQKRHTWLEMMRLLVSAKATDANTFVMRMSKPYYPMLTELAVTRPFAFVSPKVMKNGTTKDGVTSFVGSGPWILKKHVIDEYAIFERNENYWGKKPAFRRIVVKVIPDNQTRILALEKGEADLIWGKNMVDSNALNKYRDSQKFDIAVSDPTSTRQIVLNTNRQHLSDPLVRKALQHATNKKTISQGVFHGFEPPADTLYAPTLPYCNIGLKPYEYDMKKAADLLAQAGYARQNKQTPLTKNGNKLELSLLYNANSVPEKTIAEYLQSEYGKLGIKLSIRGEEEQSYRDNMKNGDFDMVFNICWGTPYDPQSSLAAMRQRVYGDYAAQLGLPDKQQIDEHITQILVSTDEATRQELYRDVLTRLHDGAVYIPITFETNKALYHKRIDNVGFLSNQYEVPFVDMTPRK